MPTGRVESLSFVCNTGHTHGGIARAMPRGEEVILRAMPMEPWDTLSDKTDHTQVA